MLRCFDKKYLTVLILTLIFSNCFSQLTPRENRKLFMKADKAFDYGDYLNALSIYNKIYPSDSTNDELNYKIGVCNFEIKRPRTQSKKYFEKVSASDFPETNYYLGRIYHLERAYDKAIGYYTQYKYLAQGVDHTRKEIDDLIQKSQTAMLMESRADNSLQIKNLGEGINSEYAEYAPLIPADGSFLMFTSRRKNNVWTNTDPHGNFFEDIYVSDRSGEEWQKPRMLDTNINTLVHDACTGLSADGEKLMLYRTSKDLKSGDIYESQLTDKKWSDPKLLGSVVNSPEFLETSACYSTNGDILFFSSNRPGGLGGKDLYLSRKLPNGNWGEPFNLGPNINTEYDEDAPFIHPAVNTLYFSSEGHKNMGGYDIFKSNFDETGLFTSPENLGAPINTADDDIFFVLSTDASTGYLSSERPGGFGSQDIYSVFFPVNNIPLNVYNIYVFDDSDKIIKSVDILITDMEKKAVHGMYKSNENTGKAIVISTPGKEYRIAIQSPGYEPYISNVKLTPDKENIFRLVKQK
ncbi:MAG: ompA [Bacteroidota bacterium]|nr:ompA [Bacteroidota bacterium]